MSIKGSGGSHTFLIILGVIFIALVLAVIGYYFIYIYLEKRRIEYKKKTMTIGRNKVIVTDKFGTNKTVKVNQFGKIDEDIELHLKVSEISTIEK